MDYQNLKKEVKEISDIACSLPEKLQEKCFEVLLNKLLESDDPEKNRKRKDDDKPPPPEDKDRIKIPQPAQMKVFMQKTGVTADELEKIVMYDGEELHFIKEPTTKTVAKGQIEWALLVALQCAITSNTLEVDPETVRSICQDKGFYDSKNFISIFKKDKYKALFQNTLVSQGPAQKLTGDGIKKLGELVKSLAGNDA